jgi:hypothetical protein
MIRKTMLLAGVLLVALSSSAAFAQDEIIEMFRSDLRAERIALIAEEMQFTDEEAGGFWPVFRRYEKELREINTARLAIIGEYAENYFDVTDETAVRMMKKSIELDIKEAYLKKKYLREFNWVLPGAKAVKFYQLENLISILIQAQIAAELPFVD